MDSKQKEILKKKILSTIKDEEQKISDLKELTKPISPENAIGRVSRMDAINNKSVNEAALRTSEAKLKKLEYALTQMDNENFGKCVVCGSDIQEARLMLMPESNKCVRCAAR